CRACLSGSAGASPSHRRDESLLLLLLNLAPQPVFLLAQFGRELGAEVRRLEHLADLDLGVLERGALEPLDRLLLRLALPQPEAGDQFLRLGERAVDDRPLPA